MYAEHKQEFLNISSTAHTFPHLEWPEPRSHFGSGSKTVSDPKSQPVRSFSVLSILDMSYFRKPSKTKKRSQTAIMTRKANRKLKRAEKRKIYRRLRKRHNDQASHHAAYPIAQECSSKIKTHQNDPMLESTAGSRLTLSNFKDRDTEPGWWDKPCFRKTKKLRAELTRMKLTYLPCKRQE